VYLSHVKAKSLKKKLHKMRPACTYSHNFYTPNLDDKIWRNCEIPYIYIELLAQTIG